VPFDDIISRADADALIPTETANQIISATTRASAALTLCRSARMSRKMSKQPVLSALPVAYWVDGDVGMKTPTAAAWTGVDLVAEEIAVLVPIPEAVLDDSSFPIWVELQPAIAEAVAEKLDAAVLAGVEKPGSWPQAIIPAARAAGNVVLIESSPATGGISNDLDELLGVVEDAGFDPTGLACRRSLRGLMRRARNAQGDRLVDMTTGTYLGLPLAYGPGGTLPDEVQAVAGAFDLAVVATRQDMTYKILDQAVISDAAGKVVLNLAQQDSLAMRVVARFAYATAIPATRDAEDGFPFATLEGEPARAARTERKLPAAKK
jgi:HK97 family phage major capsid protein